MEYALLGSTGLEVSQLCLGCYGFTASPSTSDWKLPESESLEIIEAACDLGINFFDTANIYSNGESEEVLGKAIGQCIDRDEAVVGTKLNPHIANGDGPNRSGGYSRKSLQYEIGRSRDRLGLDSIDLLQLNFLDHNVETEQTLRVLDQSIRDGTIKYFGVSTSWTYEFAEMLNKSDLLGVTRPETMQNHYNLVYREEERDKLPLCQNENIGVIPYSPFARGYLTRPHEEAVSTARSSGEAIFAERVETYQSRGGKEINHRVQELAEQKGVTMAQIALAWHFHKDWVTAPIIGVTRMEHLEDAVAALDVSLSESEMDYLEEPYQAKEMMGPNQMLYSRWKWDHGFAKADHEPMGVGDLDSF